MNKYLVQTGWDDFRDVLFPNYYKRYPEFKGDIEVLAINEKIGALSLIGINDYFLCLVIKEISAKDIEGTKILPKSKIPYLGIMNLIAN